MESTKLKKTHKEIFEFNNVASAYRTALLSEDKGSKTIYAIDKLIGNKTKHLKGRFAEVFVIYAEKQNDINIENCSINEKGHIIYDSNNNLTFTKEALRKVNEDNKKLLNESVEFEPYYVSDIKLEELTEGQIEIFTGFIIETKTQEQIAS